MVAKTSAMDFFFISGDVDPAALFDEPGKDLPTIPPKVPGLVMEALEPPVPGMRPLPRHFLHQVVRRECGALWTSTPKTDAWVSEEEARNSAACLYKMTRRHLKTLNYY